MPYVHQWSVIDTDTGNKVGEYKNRKLAEKACSNFEKYGVSDDDCGTPPEFENAWNAINKRMKRPDGDPLPNKPKRKRKHSNKRLIQLD